MKLSHLTWLIFCWLSPAHGTLIGSQHFAGTLSNRKGGSLRFSSFVLEFCIRCPCHFFLCIIQHLTINFTAMSRRRRNEPGNGQKPGPRHNVCDEDDKKMMSRMSSHLRRLLTPYKLLILFIVIVFILQILVGISFFHTVSHRFKWGLSLQIYRFIANFFISDLKLPHKNQSQMFGHNLRKKILVPVSLNYLRVTI